MRAPSSSRSSGAAAALRRYGVGLLAIAVAAAATTLIRGASVTEHVMAAYIAAILLTGWYAGTGPVAVALALAVLLDSRLPAPGAGPLGFSFDLRELWFLGFALAAASFGSFRRRAMTQLIAARDHLEDEVAARTRDLRHSQAYLLESQRLAHLGCWAVSLSLERPIYWSPELYRILDLDPTTPPDREIFGARVHPDDKGWRHTFEAAMRELREVAVELRLVHRDGAVRDVVGAGRPFLDTTGKPVEYLGVLMDVTDQRRAERALQRAREQAIRAGFEATLAERNRIAQEMHDTLIQGFTGVALKLLAVTNRASGSPELESDLREVIASAQRTLQASRRAIQSLEAPSSSGDLADAVRAAADDLARSTGFMLAFSSVGTPRPLEPKVEAAILRVAREAVLNAMKHSRGHVLRVELAYRRHTVRLAVADDGVGFDVGAEMPGSHNGHWGLLGMRRHAAEVRGILRITSTPGRGTVVALVVRDGHGAATPTVSGRSAESPAGSGQ